MAPWRLRNVTTVAAGPALNAGSFHIPAICRNGVPARSAGVAGIVGRALEWGQIIVTAPPEGLIETPWGLTSGRFF
jgi:hypothetical protein